MKIHIEQMHVLRQLDGQVIIQTSPGNGKSSLPLFERKDWHGEHDRSRCSQ